MKAVVPGDDLRSPRVLNEAYLPIHLVLRSGLRCLGVIALLAQPKARPESHYVGERRVTRKKEKRKRRTVHPSQKK